MVQMLLNVERFCFLHRSIYGIIAVIVTVLTFEPNLKNPAILESAHMWPSISDFELFY